MIFDEYEINFLLFGTPTIFHNKGLSIYSLQENIVKKSTIDFKKNFETLEKVFVPSFDNRLNISSSNIKKVFKNIFEDLKVTTDNLIENCAYQAVLLSHKNLKVNMQPHIHRQAYANDRKKCVTFHYNLGNIHTANFDYWNSVSQEDVINNNLCDNSSIHQWCKNKKYKTLNLTEQKNIIIFDSGSIPHRVKHNSDFNVYFIFDYADLKISTPTESIVLFK